MAKDKTPTKQKGAPNKKSGAIPIDKNSHHKLHPGAWLPQAGPLPKRGSGRSSDW